MARTSRTDPVAMVRRGALPLQTAADLDPLLGAIGEARVVLLGEATHGTQEFYGLRAELSRRLIEERGFAAVAIEGDWPDAYRVNRFVRGEGGDRTPEEALCGFRRFPTWMWRNEEVISLVSWLRAHGLQRPPEARVGFYGLDLYSLHASAAAVIEYLERVDPEAARLARERYACLDHADGDAGEDAGQRYGLDALLRARPECERAVVEQLAELERRAGELLARDGLVAADEQFCAEQNARVVQRAEQYYREAFRGRVNTWNLRDRHLADTLAALTEHLGARGSGKVVVWAHDSHVGDARATEAAEQGELNLGQLARERWGEEAFLVGFTTYRGAVTAAREWGGPALHRRVRPALPGSLEELLHEASEGRPASLLLLRGGPRTLARALEPRRLQRAIGVVYRPESERTSHYLHAHAARQYDALIHVDETRAVIPLERTQAWERGELPEAFPTGL